MKKIITIALLCPWLQISAASLWSPLPSPAEASCFIEYSIPLLQERNYQLSHSISAEIVFSVLPGSTIPAERLIYGFGAELYPFEKGFYLAADMEAGIAISPLIYRDKLYSAAFLTTVGLKGSAGFSWDMSDSLEITTGIYGKINAVNANFSGLFGYANVGIQIGIRLKKD